MRGYNRYQQPVASQSYLDLKEKQLVPPKVSFSSSHKSNPQYDLLKLPALNSMRRTASISATERNTKFKLQNLDGKLQQLAAQVHNTRLDSQQAINHVRFLKESLAINELGRIREDCKKQIRGLQRLVHSTMAADQQRYTIVRNDCSQLWNQTESMRQNIFQLQMRIDKLDLGMGFKNK